MIAFMLPAWFISIWMSNISSIVMLLSILEGVLQQLQEQHTNPLHEATNSLYNLSISYFIFMI